MGGRGASIWDHFSHVQYPLGRNRTSHGDTGDVACDQYHRYTQDVALIKKLGFNSCVLARSRPPCARGSARVS